MVLILKYLTAAGILADPASRPSHVELTVRFVDFHGNPFNAVTKVIAIEKSLDTNFGN
jgi:hypothetical protein